MNPPQRSRSCASLYRVAWTGVTEEVLALARAVLSFCAHMTLSAMIEKHEALPSRRKFQRYLVNAFAQWDFYSAGGGAKSGILENISEKGCLLRVSDPIENRRWIRLLVHPFQDEICFTAVGRIVRREDRMEFCHTRKIVTLYRVGIELVQPLNAVVLARAQNAGPAKNQRHFSLILA